MSRSTYAFCQGDLGAVGRSRIPIDLSRFMKDLTIGAVIVADQVGWRGVPRERLDDLLRQPFGRRMPGHSEPKQLAAPMTDDNKCKQALECRRVDHAQIDRCDRVRMIAQKRSPGLRRWPAMADHVLGDRRLGDLEPKLEQFTVDAGGTPEPVLPAHPPNEFAQFATDLGASRPTARLPTPVGSKPCSMPLCRMLQIPQ